MSDPEELVALDAEIARLHEHAAETDDELAAVLARSLIDELLERRYALTSDQ